MNFTAIEIIPIDELKNRRDRCRALLRSELPEAGGLIAFSRVNIYYFTGTLANGLLWLPVEGEPVLLCRKGIERARLESPHHDIYPFRSYSDVPGLLKEAGSPLADKVAVGMSGLSWSLADLLKAKLPGREFVNGDSVIARTRSVKTEWELAKMRLCGARHHECLYDILPKMIHGGMTERELSHKAWEVFFAKGHSGNMRMNNFGEEIFLGHVAAGDSGNYPSVFNGPVGIRGEHPAVPFMGYAGQIWQTGAPLAMDIGFCLEGYQTDKTQVYWSGPRKSIPDEAARAHDLCVEVQALIADWLKPGEIPSLIHAKAMELGEKKGFSEGFMALDGNKVAFTGHGIGLAIDEYPVLARGFDAPLEKGMVMAVEPKIGLPGLGMVGVENTFEVTDQGGKCLTGDDYSIVCVE